MDKKYFIVFNESRCEAVVFDDLDDARYAAGEDIKMTAPSSIACYWREMCGLEEGNTVEEIDAMTLVKVEP